VLCKTSHVEQEYNVDGIERLGLGKSLDEIEPADYFAMIEAWVENKYSKKLLCLKKKISDSNSRFEIIIENLLNVCFHKNKPKEAMLHSEAGEILWKAEKMSAGQI
jgi:hypothetical protein